MVRSSSIPPKQKLLVAGGREEFMVSVPSLCHCANPLSITVPSSNTNSTFQNPTIRSSESWCATSKNEAGLNGAGPCQCCGCTVAVCPPAYPHWAVALETKTVPRKSSARVPVIAVWNSVLMRCSSSVEFGPWAIAWSPFLPPCVDTYAKAVPRLTKHGSSCLYKRSACLAARSSRIMGPHWWPLGPDQGPDQGQPSVVCGQKQQEDPMDHPHPQPPRHPTDHLVGTWPAIAALRTQIRHLAAFDTLGNPAVPTVLLQGETGTGKGLVARAFHDSGPRTQGPFLDVNCAAIPETLLEAELFGVTAGAFTDAKRAKPGLFETAAGGTLFLDEIDALPLALQGKLLTSIEAKRVRRVGAVREQAVDVKVVAATQAELSARVAAGRFRADLYHRLAVIVLALPPLRDRGADIVLLAQQFLQQYAAAHRLPSKRLSRAAAEWLQGYDWPGNVRELSHLMERVMLLHPEARIDPQTLERLCLPRAPAATHTTAAPA